MSTKKKLKIMIMPEFQEYNIKIFEIQHRTEAVIHANFCSVMTIKKHNCLFCYFLTSDNSQQSFCHYVNDVWDCCTCVIFVFHP